MNFPLSFGVNCSTREKHGFGSQTWWSPGISIRMEAHLAFSGCCWLTFNITERGEVESQVPYMHIWPPANVRGGRSHTLILASLTQKHYKGAEQRVSISAAKGKARLPERNVLGCHRLRTSFFNRLEFRLRSVLYDVQWILHEAGARKLL